jgi:predicted anti-sigma-YlaC factor YlaD
MKMRCHKARKNMSLALDSRLPASARERLQAHLDACPSCRDWRQEQLGLLELLRTPRALPALSPDFYAALREKINGFPARAKFLPWRPLFLEPALLRAAALLILVFSALLGFFLGRGLDAPAVNSSGAVFSRTMNLDAFADLPAESFGGVYERLRQGDLQ